MADPANLNSFDALSELTLPSGRVWFYRLAALQEQGLCRLERLPFSIRILLEQALRSEDGKKVTADDVKKLHRKLNRVNKKLKELEKAHDARPEPPSPTTLQ